MALTERATQSVGGPRGGTSWTDQGGDFTLASIASSAAASFTATTTQPGDICVQTITRPNPFYLNVSQPLAAQDFLDSTQIIQALYGFQVTAAVLQAAFANLTIQLSVYRTVATLSGAGGASTTSVPLTAPLTQAIPNSSTLTITKVDGSTSTTLTLTAAAAAGATSLAVSSVNLTGYANLSNISWQVGGGAAYGWVGGSGGTPAFPKGVSVVAPIISTNTSLITTGALPWAAPNGTTTAQAGALPLQSGDALILTVQTSSTTATVQPLNVELLVT